jgi:very-short-patch-repair endonuclease
MSVSQRDQIEKAFEDIQKQDIALQNAVDKNLDSEDPLFFKNLENVQGDERDVIYISCTYGPQEYGAPVHQRFGPINSDNGWRRLNVLFTRSKKRMHVFSSMQHTDIVPSANTKEGVVAFRNFLEYAVTGRTSHPKITGNDADSDFEIDVASALYKHGYECEFQVGAAGYFIDLAVRDPGSPGRFLMGIECDGATYHSAKSVRDRDRLRQEILENMDWKISRIWSTDWFSNPESQLNPIIEELNSLRSEVIEPIPIEETSLNESEQRTLAFLDEGKDLTVEQALKHFDHQVISAESKGIDTDKKLPSTSMIDALIEFQPTTRSEFTEMIPRYIRTKVDPSKGK